MARAHPGATRRGDSGVVGGDGGAVRALPAHVRLLDGTRRVHAVARDHATNRSTGAMVGLIRPDSQEDEIKSYEEIEEMLVAYVAQRSGKPAGEIDRERRFDRLGLDSADAVALVGELEDFVDRPLSAYLPYQHPTIHQLARRGAGGDSCRPRGAGAPAEAAVRCARKPARLTRCPPGRTFSLL